MLGYIRSEQIIRGPPMAPTKLNELPSPYKTTELFALEKYCRDAGNVWARRNVIGSHTTCSLRRGTSWAEPLSRQFSFALTNWAGNNSWRRLR